MYKILLMILINCTNILSVSFFSEHCKDIFINEILKKYFENKYCLTILLLNNNYDPEILYTRFDVPTIVKLINTTSLKTNYNMKIKPRRDIFDKERNIHKLCSESGTGYLIIVEKITDLVKYIFSEMINAFCSPQAKIFIYFSEEFCDNFNETIYEKLWTIYKAPHIVISGCNCENIFYYNPYRIVNNNTWGKLFNYSKEMVLNKASLIENKMKNFNKYPIKAMVFRSPFSKPKGKNKFVGIDVNLLEVIAQKANLTNIIVLPSDDDQYGFKLPNGTYTGALGKLLNAEIDYVNVNFFIKDYLTIDIEFSASTTSDNLCVIMRKAEKIPDWQLLYYCMDEITWIAVVTIYFVVSIIWITFEKILAYFREDLEVYPFIFTDTFRLMITSSLYRLPTTHTERMFLSFCLMAFVTLVGAFQGSLFGVYSTLMFYKDVETLEELSRTETQIKSEYMFFIDDVFSDVNYPVIAKLKSMISFYNDTISITKRVAEQHNFATLIRKSEVQIDNSTTTYYDDKGINLIHMVKECPRSYNLAYPFPVNSAFLPVLNMIMLRAAQAGLLVKWYDEMAFNVSSTKGNIIGIGDALKVFSLKDMQISFFQLIIGLVLGIIVFIIEMVIYSCDKNKFPDYKKSG